MVAVPAAQFLCESSRRGYCREWAWLGSRAALVTNPSGRPDLSPVSQHWCHGSFCLMVTKRLLSPRELKPPPSLLVSWAVASAPTHDWASFQVRVWSDSEPAAERVSLAPAALWFPEGITNPLPVQIKEQLYHGRTYWKVMQGHQEGKGIHSLVRVLRLGWESLRLGKVSEDACLTLAGLQGSALTAWSTVLGWFLCSFLWLLQWLHPLHSQVYNSPHCFTPSPTLIVCQC